MTPAEYARSQGWRVGDLVDTYCCSVWEIVKVAPLTIEMPECLKQARCIPARPCTDWRRIGRVLRPNPAPDAGTTGGEK